MLGKFFLSQEAAQVADDDLLPFNEGLVDQFLFLTNHAVLNPFGDFPLPLCFNRIIDCLDFAAERSMKWLSDFNEGVLVPLGSLAFFAKIVVLAY